MLCKEECVVMVIIANEVFVSSFIYLIYTGDILADIILRTFVSEGI